MTSDLEVGDIIEDNDPRMPNRKLKVVGFESGKMTPYGRRVLAICLYAVGTSDRQFRIRTDAIYTDGKPRRTGFSRSRENV